MYYFKSLVARMIKIGLLNRILDYKLLFVIPILMLECGCAIHSSNRITQQRLIEKGPVGAYRWVVESPSGVHFQFVQRIPDQTRAFYMAREFSTAAANKYATACIFQAILNNNSKNLVIKTDLSSWRVIQNGKKSPLPLERDWQKIWKKMNISNSGRIAFRWSQFPTIQIDKPGDWFQGMTAANLPPGSKFDLYLKWYENDKPREAVIHKLQCADDRRLVK